jgi:hypothetical protein
VRYAVAVGLEGLALGCGWSQDHPGHGHTCTALARLGDPSDEEAAVVRLRAALALRRLQPS